MSVRCASGHLRFRNLLKFSEHEVYWDQQTQATQLKQCNSLGRTRHLAPLVSPTLGTGHGAQSLSSGLAASGSHPGRGEAPVCTFTTGYIRRVKATQARGCLLFLMSTGLLFVAWCQHLPAHVGLGTDALGLKQVLVRSGSAACNRTQIRDARHGPTVPFIWPYYVSSALLMVLICSHLLTFILLMHSLYSFVSEVHLGWSFSCLFFLRCSVSSCFFNESVVWQDAF